MFSSWFNHELIFCSQHNASRIIFVNFRGTHSFHLSERRFQIQVVDGDNTFDYRIFMNNVLNYRGYRFFQSSYDSDEKGTILSVNQDKWGTIVTYFGYLSLLLSVLSLMISRFSRINLLTKKLNNNS